MMKDLLQEQHSADIITHQNRIWAGVVLSDCSTLSDRGDANTFHYKSCNHGLVDLLISTLEEN